jgi:hypothetical protein
MKPGRCAKAAEVVAAEVGAAGDHPAVADAVVAAAGAIGRIRKHRGRAIMLERDVAVDIPHFSPYRSSTSATQISVFTY